MDQVRAEERRKTDLPQGPDVIYQGDQLFRSPGIIAKLGGVGGRRHTARRDESKEDESNPAPRIWVVLIVSAISML